MLAAPRLESCRDIGEIVVRRSVWPKERLRAAIADMPLPITASIGVAAHALIHIGDSDVEAVITDLVAAADHGMYRAKRAGGDRVQRVPAHGAADAQRAVHSGASGL